MAGFIGKIFEGQTHGVRPAPLHSVGQKEIEELRLAKRVALAQAKRNREENRQVAVFEASEKKKIEFTTSEPASSGEEGLTSTKTGKYVLSNLLGQDPLPADANKQVEENRIAVTPDVVEQVNNTSAKSGIKTFSDLPKTLPPRLAVEIGAGVTRSSFNVVNAQRQYSDTAAVNACYTRKREEIRTSIKTKITDEVRSGIETVKEELRKKDKDLIEKTAEETTEKELTPLKDKIIEKNKESLNKEAIENKINNLKEKSIFLKFVNFLMLFLPFARFSKPLFDERFDIYSAQLAKKKVSNKKAQKIIDLQAQAKFKTLSGEKITDEITKKTNEYNKSVLEGSNIKGFETRVNNEIQDRIKTALESRKDEIEASVNAEVNALGGEAGIRATAKAHVEQMTVDAYNQWLAHSNALSGLKPFESL